VPCPAGPLLAAALLAAASPTPSLVSIPNDRGQFCLTFDADAGGTGAAGVLGLLRQRGVRATIFATGRFAERFPDLLSAAVADGHEIGNHTYDHPHLTTWAEAGRHGLRPGVDRAFVRDQLERAAAAIAAACGRAPAPLWRAPYGEHNGAIRAWAAEAGYLHVDWTRGATDALDALDWVDAEASRRYLTPAGIARRLLSFERRTGVPLSGSIILMHLGTGRASHPLLEALPVPTRRPARPATGPGRRIARRRSADGVRSRVGRALSRGDASGARAGLRRLPVHRVEQRAVAFLDHAAFDLERWRQLAAVHGERLCQEPELLDRLEARQLAVHLLDDALKQGEDVGVREQRREVRGR
jgi:peptidoglycan/xylan/chitin deacetylase (PgdA/CDA1 family)